MTIREVIQSHITFKLPESNNLLTVVTASLNCSFVNVYDYIEMDDVAPTLNKINLLNRRNDYFKSIIWKLHQK